MHLDGDGNPIYNGVKVSYHVNPDTLFGRVHIRRRQRSRFDIDDEQGNTLAKSVPVILMRRRWEEPDRELVNFWNKTVLTGWITGPSDARHHIGQVRHAELRIIVRMLKKKYDSGEGENMPDPIIKMLSESGEIVLDGWVHGFNAKALWDALLLTQKTMPELFDNPM